VLSENWNNGFQYQKGQQQDAQECLGFLLDKLGGKWYLIEHAHAIDSFMYSNFIVLNLQL
jgi:uncharacterized UBP type Zn finger protein